MIDLHSHTNESDGTCSPAQLIEEAVEAGVNILGITDHDTFRGYEQAVPLAAPAGVELVCGIELSTKLHGRSVHLLGYFLAEDGLADFREWVLDLQASRRERNIRLVARLRELGFDITLEEAEARGRGMTGRPHFAQIMVEKGYVPNLRAAFDDYLDESAKGYVYRREPRFAEGVDAHSQGRRDCFAGASRAREGRRGGDAAGVVRHRHERHRGLSQRPWTARDRAVPGPGAALQPAGDRRLGFPWRGKAGRAAGQPVANGNLHVPEDLLERLRRG